MTGRPPPPAPPQWGGERLRLRQLKWQEIAHPGDVFHLARVRVDASYDTPLHTHDFAEVFWVEDGSALHTINGHAQVLGAGSLVTIRPSDAHMLAQHGNVPFTLVNLAFDVSALNFLQARYEPGNAFWWQEDVLPWTMTLSEHHAFWLARNVERLAAAPQHPIELDRFLIGLLSELRTTPSTSAPSHDPRPTWIADVLRQLKSPEHFSLGAGHIAQLSHRTPEHVTRELKRYTGMTTVEWVTKARLDFAERQLRMTTEEISQIALACGFNSLAHFYKVFRARFGLAPHAYRVRHQATVR